MALQSISQCDLDVIFCATVTLPKFSIEEINSARLRNTGPAGIDSMSIRFLTDEKVTQFTEYISPLRLRSVETAITRPTENGQVNDLGEAYKSLVSQAKQDVARMGDLGPHWLGINTQLTREQGLSVSNASMVLHLMNRRGTAFTVSQLGVVAPVKAWQIADIWRTTPDLNVMMTAGDRWVAIYDRNNLKGRRFADGAGLGCFRLTDSIDPNFFSGLMRIDGLAKNKQAAIQPTEYPSEACISLIDALITRMNRSSAKLHFFSPPLERLDLHAIDRAIRSTFLLRACFHAPEAEHRGSAQWLRSLERFLTEGDQRSDLDAAVFWDLEPGGHFGATLFRPKSNTLAQ